MQAAGLDEYGVISHALTDTADALDKLREAVRGCGKRLDAGITARCGDPETEWLCYGCQLKLRAAIALLLGNTGEAR